MNDDALLLEMLDDWQEALLQGRKPTAAELCGSRQDLIAKLEEQMAVLRRFSPLDGNRLLSQETQLLDPTTSQRTPNNSGSDQPAIGTMFGPFRLLSVLGEGGFGTVYRAEDTQLQRKVALKILHPATMARTGAQESFLAEARALASVQHDHVVPIYQVGQEQGRFFLAMPLLGGETLATRLEREGALPIEDVRRIGRETAFGIAAIHAQGLVHRDIKPGNLWLEAGTGRVKVLDLGLANQPRTPTDLLTGTPPYMSPEQSQGEPLDFRSDLFSLGSVLYECATGKRAFDGTTMLDTLHQVRETQPLSAHDANPGVPVELSHLIEQLLAKQPTQRPASAREVAERLQGPTLVTPKRHRYAWPLLVTGLLLLAVSLWWSAVRPTATHRKIVKPAPAAPVVTTVEPLRIRKFDVLRFATVNEAVTPRGVLGRDTYEAILGDEFEVRVQLSKPAYAFLIVYRPDGQDEVLYPQDDTDLPALSDTLLYPTKRRDERYVMEEGTGLWVVALVTSDEPLPNYRTWRATRSARSWAKYQSQPNVVWYDDGQVLDTLPVEAKNRGPKVAADRAPVVRLVDELRERTRGVVAALAFTVEERRKE